MVMEARQPFGCNVVAELEDQIDDDAHRLQQEGIAQIRYGRELLAELGHDVHAMSDTQIREALQREFPDMQITDLYYSKDPIDEDEDEVAPQSTRRPILVG